MQSSSSRSSRRDVLIEELLQQVSDPTHKRLLQAYRGSDPVQFMEAELSNILMEVLRGEDQEHNDPGPPGVQ